jgi:hypothetical protein
MADRVAELRKKSRHCRELANYSPAGVMRTELAKMAAEFADQADKVDRLGDHPEALQQ